MYLMQASSSPHPTVINYSKETVIIAAGGSREPTSNILGSYWHRVPELCMEHQSLTGPKSKSQSQHMPSAIAVHVIPVCNMEFNAQPTSCDSEYTHCLCIRTSANIPCDTL